MGTSPGISRRACRRSLASAGRSLDFGGTARRFRCTSRSAKWRSAENENLPGILHDLSARVHIEEQLREQTALARLGEMAAVIAHEVKNPLAGVRGAIQVIGRRLPKESKDAAMITEIVARIDALNELMQDLLLFARPPQPKPAPVDIAALVATTADLLRSNPALTDMSRDG